MENSSQASLTSLHAPLRQIGRSSGLVMEEVLNAQHLAAELVGRFERIDHGVASIALTTDTSILTAVGNVTFESVADGKSDCSVDKVAVASSVAISTSEML